MAFFDFLMKKQQPQLPLTQVQEGTNGGAELAQPSQVQNKISPIAFAHNVGTGLRNAEHKFYEKLLGEQPENNNTEFTNKLLGSEAVNDYQNYLRQNNYDDSVVNGVTQGLNHGHKEIDDWIKQYNNGVGASNPINIPQTKDEIELAHQGLFNNLMSAKVQQSQEQTTQPVNRRIGGAIPDLLNGFKENFNNGFTLNNWGNNDLGDRNKGLLYRIGEGLGSAARIVNSPLGRGLAIGGLAAASGEDGLDALRYGLHTTVTNQQNVLNDKLYRQALINNYGYKPEQLNTIGYVGKDTFKNLADSSYKNSLNSYRNRKLDQTSYVKMVKELDTLHKTGQLSDDAYLATLRDLNLQYEDSNTYDITNIGVSNDTKKTNSQVALNDARIENIKNPKPRVNISYRYGKTDVNHNHTSGGGTTNANTYNGGKPIGTSNNTGKVKMRYQDKIYLVDANRVNEYINAGGEVVK